MDSRIGYEGEIIARSAAGRADEEQLGVLISEAWHTALSEPGEKAEIAALLGVKEDELDPARPPFRAEIAEAGLTGGEVLIALALGFAGGFTKDMAGAAGRATAQKLRELWTDYIRDRVSPPGTGKLGRPKDDSSES